MSSDAVIGSGNELTRSSPNVYGPSLLGRLPMQRALLLNEDCCDAASGLQRLLVERLAQTRWNSETTILSSSSRGENHGKQQVE